MVKRTQGLPLNTIILAIIAIIVLVFLIGKFILRIPNQPNRPTPPPYPIPSPNQTIFEQCAQYAAAIQQQMGTSIDPFSQLQMLANSSYVSSGCSINFQYAFTLYNDSVVICGLNSSQCIILSGSDSCSSCQPPDCIPGCQLR